MKNPIVSFQHAYLPSYLNTDFKPSLNSHSYPPPSPKIPTLQENFHPTPHLAIFSPVQRRRCRVCLSFLFVFFFLSFSRVSFIFYFSFAERVSSSYLPPLPPHLSPQQNQSIHPVPLSLSIHPPEKKKKRRLFSSAFCPRTYPSFL